MKKIYCFLLFLVATAASAQVITQNNYALAGESYPAIGHYNAPWTPGGIGANQTWDFSGLINPTTSTFDYINPAAAPAPYNTLFASSDIGVSPLTGQYSFFLSSPTEYQISGTVSNFGTAIARPYANPQRIITFPFAYNDKLKDTAYTNNYPYTGGNYQRRYIGSESEADAYGSITLPGGTTYNNVLRLRITTLTKDSTFNSSDVFVKEDISIDTNYYWISPDHKPHLFVLTKSVQKPYTTPVTTVIAQYFTSVSAPTAITAAYNSYFNVYPNPFSSELFIETDQSLFNSKPSLSITIYNSNGNEVAKHFITTSRVSIPRNGLSSGLYLYKINSEDKVLSTGKLTVQ